MRTAEELARGRENNFNLIRMVAASSVIISHSFPLALGTGAAEPFHGWMFPFDLGKAAVRVFFAISGFFILKSFERRSSTFQFVMARIGRIAPGLLIVTSITSLLTIAGISFASNPYPDLVNGSLWTLWFEASCYVGLTIAGLSGLYRRGRFGIFLIAYELLYFALHVLPLRWGWAYSSLSLPFVFGMAVYHFRRRFPLDGRVAALLIALATFARSDPVWSVALGYTALWFGAVAPQLRAYNRLGDYSYGTYIFAWPIQQTIALCAPGISPIGLMLLALPSTWMLGVVSWHFIEHPALRFAHSIGLPRWSGAAFTKLSDEAQPERLQLASSSTNQARGKPI